MTGLVLANGKEIANDDPQRSATAKLNVEVAAIPLKRAADRRIRAFGWQPVRLSGFGRVGKSCS
jgi:hypothetical protein